MELRGESVIDNYVFSNLNTHLPTNLWQSYYLTETMDFHTLVVYAIFKCAYACVEIQYEIPFSY